jgi:hypothetical protein
MRLPMQSEWIREQGGGGLTMCDSFEETVANAAILRLHTAALWAEVSESRGYKLIIRT